MPGVIVPSLLYHDVSDDPLPGLERYTVSRREFGRQLAAVAASGRQPMTVSGLADAVRSGRVPARPVVLSFDDGFRGWPDVAEALAEHGIRAATMYVTSGFLDRSGYLRRQQLAAFPHWVELGAHSVTHQRLDELDDAELRRELTESRDVVAQASGRSCDSFAYPHGAYSRRERDLVGLLGYRSAAAVKNAYSHAADDPLALARWTVTAGTTEATFQRILDAAGGAPVAWSRERLRTRASRTVRRWRRRRAAR